MAQRGFSLGSYLSKRSSGAQQQMIQAQSAAAQSAASNQGGSVGAGAGQGGGQPIDQAGLVSGGVQGKDAGQAGGKEKSGGETGGGATREAPTDGRWVWAFAGCCVIDACVCALLDYSCVCLLSFSVTHCSLSPLWSLSFHRLPSAEPSTAGPASNTGANTPRKSTEAPTPKQIVTLAPDQSTHSGSYWLAAAISLALLGGWVYWPRSASQLISSHPSAVLPTHNKD